MQCCKALKEVSRSIFTFGDNILVFDILVIKSIYFGIKTNLPHLTPSRHLMREIELSFYFTSTLCSELCSLL